jgi:PAS domain S-box-containing protein
LIGNPAANASGREQSAPERPLPSRQLLALAEAQRQFSLRVPEPELLLRDLAEWTAFQFEADCIIRLISTDGVWLEPAAVSFGSPEATRFTWDVLGGSWHRVSDGLNGLVLDHGQPILLAQTTGAELLDMALEEYRPHLEQIGVASLLIVPLRAREQLLGTISLSRARPGHPFGEEDRAFLEEIADRAGSIVDNALLLVRARASERREQLTGDVSARLVTCTSVPEIASVVREALMAGFAESCAVAFSELPPMSGNDAARLRGAGAAADLDGIIRQAIQGQRSILRTAPAQRGEAHSGRPRNRALSAMAEGDGVMAAVPVSVSGAAAGAIAVARSRAPFFTREDLVALEEISRRVGSVIEAVSLDASLRRELLERRAVERELRRSEERLVLALESAQMAAWEADLATGEIAWSPNAAAVLGLGHGPPPRTWTAWLEDIHPSDRAQVEDMRQRAAEGTRPWSVDYRVLRPDGPVRWAMSRARAPSTPDGAPTHVLGIHLDIADRKRAEQATRRSERRVRALLDLLPGIVWILRPDGHVEFVNERWGNLTGIPVTEMVGRAWTVACHPDDIDPALAAWEKAVRSSSPFELELRYRMHDGHYRWFLTRLAPVRRESGRPARWLGTSIDIDDRQRAEASRRQFARLVESSQELIAIAAADGRLTYLNAAGRRLLGIADGSLSPILVQDVIDLPPPFRGQNGASEGRLNLESWTGETRLMPPRGRDAIDVEAAVFPIADEAGSRLQGIAVIARDIRERTASERQRQEFLSSLVHDLRNPVTTIKAQAQLLGRRLTNLPSIDPDRVAQGLEAIDEAVAVLVTMLQELDDLGRLRIGEPLTLRAAPLDLVSLARAVASEPRLAERAHRIEVASDRPEVVGEWDSARLRRVLDNLLSNATKYSGAGSTISIRLRVDSERGEDWAVLEVEDEGIGIPKRDLPFIFERFRRGGNTNPGVVGSGIGLAGVKQLVAQHGGTITATSSEGAGSCFVVRLPTRMP